MQSQQATNVEMVNSNISVSVVDKEECCSVFNVRAEQIPHCLLIYFVRLERTANLWFKLCTVSMARHPSMPMHSEVQ